MCSFPEFTFIENSNFRGNRAERSCGAVLAHSSYASRPSGIIPTFHGQLEYNNFINNKAKHGYGGALCTYGLRVKGSLFSRNRATLHGGAVFAANVTFVEYSTFERNYAKELGGGVYLQETTSRTRPLIIDYCNFTSNEALDSGGAGFSEASLVVAHSFVEDNNATYGGAFATDGEILTLKIINTTLENNWARVSGGAVWLGGLVTTYLFENSSLIDNYCWRSGGAVHLFAPFTQNPTKFVSTVFKGNYVLPGVATADLDGGDVALNSSVAVFANVTIMSVLITDWSESRSAPARANFTNSLFLDDPRVYLSMQGATVSISLINCSYVNATDAEDEDNDKQHLATLASRLHVSPRSLLESRKRMISEEHAPAIIPVPYTDSSVIACSVGRFFSNTSAGAHCQPCSQGQYNFDGTSAKCFDCPNRIGCVDIRSNIQYEVAKGYQPAPATKPQRVLKCKMHMSASEKSAPHDDADPDPDEPHESAPEQEDASAPETSHHDARTMASAMRKIGLFEDYDDPRDFVHDLAPVPRILASSTRHIVPRPAMKINSFSQNGAAPSNPIIHADDGHSDVEEDAHADSEHSPCLPTFCRSVCKPTFGNLTIANCLVECSELKCSDGYEGRLCAKCECLSGDHCWYRSHHACHRCRPPDRLWPSIVLLAVSLFVFTVFRRRLLKILFFCVAVAAISLVLTQVGDRFLVSWLLIAFIVFLEKVKYEGRFCG